MKTKFDEFNPILRGRKKNYILETKEEFSEENFESVQLKEVPEIRKSNRKRKIKEIEDYVNPDATVKNSDPKIVKLNAGNYLFYLICYRDYQK